MTTVIPILRYRDPAAAVVWLQEAFGFTQHFVAEGSQQVVHAQMRIGDALIMLGPDDADDRYGMHSPMAFNGTSQCVYIVETGDLDRSCARAKKAGATIITEPYDTPYGSREFTCRDFEGHIWSVGSYAGEPLD